MVYRGLIVLGSALVAVQAYLRKFAGAGRSARAHTTVVVIVYTSMQPGVQKVTQRGAGMLVQGSYALLLGSIIDISYNQDESG